MNILMIAFESGRWGPSRLPKALSQAGFQVAALCPSDNALAQTRFLDRHFPLPDVRSSRSFERRLVQAMREWRPDLIVPADERTVACLHALVRRTGSGGHSRLTQGERDTVVASLGDPTQLDAMLLKSRTQALARQIGVLVPEGMSVASSDAAIEAAERIGFPVYVKESFGWAGQGVSLCQDRAAVATAMTATKPAGFRMLRKGLKRLLHRDWYPTDTEIGVQRAIEGTPAMFCAVAVSGRMLAGFAGVAQQTTSTTGPSSVVWIGADAAMAKASAAMIEALGATGFIGFDFMIETGTGAAYLLECNPRPIQVCHLGPRVGVDLCHALADGMRGDTASPGLAAGSETIALFPQEWQRDPESIGHSDMALDIPWDDPPLLRAMVAVSPESASPPRLDRPKMRIPKRKTLPFRDSRHAAIWEAQSEVTP